jgi:hypothetical protein
VPLCEMIEGVVSAYFVRHEPKNQSWFWDLSETLENAKTPCGVAGGNPFEQRLGGRDSGRDRDGGRAPYSSEESLASGTRVRGCSRAVTVA